MSISTIITATVDPEDIHNACVDSLAKLPIYTHASGNMTNVVVAELGSRLGMDQVDTLMQRLEFLCTDPMFEEAFAAWVAAKRMKA